MSIVGFRVRTTDGASRLSGTTLAAQAARRPVAASSTHGGTVAREVQRGEDRVAMQIGLRRALTVGCAMWISFFAIDVAAVRYLHAGALPYFAVLRIAGAVVLFLAVVRMRRAPAPTERTLATVDVAAYSSATVGIALMCVEFRGLASLYVPGCCLVLLGRSVTAQDPWKRGVVMNGIPVALFFAVLLGSAAFSSRVADQIHDPAAVTTLLINSAYVLSTYVLLVICGHIVWSLRRQVFEARNLGRYRLKRRLATGGMGDVWAAYHPGLKRDVAVKILRPDQQERSASAQARFEREVRATAELMHPNTVRVFDYGVTEDGLWYYVMELLNGETLAEHVARLGSLPPSRALHIVGQAARALGEAHERGIVHRDVKPENLFLTSLGGEHDFVKVIDFGIAKVKNVEETMTKTGLVLGTPAYMSPEVAIGGAADARSDVYALGEVLYFLLCGRPPFQADTAGALIFAQVNERVVAPSRVLGRPLPRDVESVVMRALEKDPAARYETGAELALALAECSLAGRWTFGDAAYAARQSSRPPTSGVVETTLPSLGAPRVPSISVAVEKDEVAPPRVMTGKKT
jgi:eukaryotic-like serine/threonine-protein kinase